MDQDGVIESVEKMTKAVARDIWDGYQPWEKRFSPLLNQWVCSHAWFYPPLFRVSPTAALDYMLNKPPGYKEHPIEVFLRDQYKRQHPPWISLDNLKPRPMDPPAIRTVQMPDSPPDSPGGMAIPHNLPAVPQAVIPVHQPSRQDLIGPSPPDTPPIAQVPLPPADTPPVAQVPLSPAAAGAIAMLIFV